MRLCVIVGFYRANTAKDDTLPEILYTGYAEMRRPDRLLA